MSRVRMNKLCRQSCQGRKIDVKSFLAGMFLAGFMVALQQTVGSMKNKHLRQITYSDLAHTSMSARVKIIGSQGDQLLCNSKQRCVEASSTTSIDGEGDESAQQASMPGEGKEDNKPQQYGDEGGGDGEADVMITKKKRSFSSYGHALALFVHMASYRGGPDSFSMIGLGAKPAHVYGDAGFQCEWTASAPSSGNSSSDMRSIKGSARKFLPDWNLGRQYTVVVVICTFDEAVGTDRAGGSLVVHATHGEGSGIPSRAPVRILALTEREGEYDARRFLPPYPYEFVYCGSPLYGQLNPQRIREWIAHHARLFGRRAHFFLYDAGGVTDDVARVLRPWQELGYVSIHDIRDQERFDGYYHNQFLVANDCLHRTRFLPLWTFFFDVDEFLWVPHNQSLRAIMDSFSNYTQVIFRQKPMAAHICQVRRPNEDDGHDGKQSSSSRDEVWAMEELVYMNVTRGVEWDRKYAIQPRNALTAGVHRSDDIIKEDIVQQSLGYYPNSLVPNLYFYHFHGTINFHGDLCHSYAPRSKDVLPSASSNASLMSSGTGSNIFGKPNPEEHELLDFYDIHGTPFRLDTGLRDLAPSIKEFERQTGIL